MVPPTVGIHMGYLALQACRYPISGTHRGVSVSVPCRYLPILRLAAYQQIL